uniref:Uncharacterized protein n=1 Tax=Zooxanthella nutricula TaxID=1333877 RepID=A0A7S2NPM8_9DINO
MAMGVHSEARKRQEKMSARKTGKHARILTKKRLKNHSQQERRALQKARLAAKEDDRGRVHPTAAQAASSAVADAAMGAAMQVERLRSKSKPVRAGQGSGTPGARTASAKLEKAVQVSKRGGRRKKATWRAFGKK